MKTIILLLLSINSIFPQLPNLKVRQITNIEGDARNPFIAQDPYLNFQPDIFFEIHKGNSSNIAFTNYYNSQSRRFSAPVYVTNNSSLNINPKCIQFPSYSGLNDFLFFQTNETGNWLIAYKTRKDSVWSNTRFVDSTSIGETNPSLLFVRPYNNFDSVRVLYQKGHSIFLATYKDSSFYTEEVFKGNDSVIYSQPTGFPYNVYSAPYVYNLFIDVAVAKIINGDSIIVYKTKNDSSGTWSEEKIVDDTNECSNPKFLAINSSFCLTYEIRSGKYRNINFINDWGSNNYTQSIIDSVQGSVSDLQTCSFYIIVDKLKIAKRNYDINNIHAYRYFKNDSMYISTNKFPNLFISYTGIPDTLIYTKVVHTGLAVGFINTDSGTVNVVWEDSTDGHIELFGLDQAIIENVESSLKPLAYKLYQNYPNPFNPSTTIKYEIPKETKVTIKLYDVLGREIATLLNTTQNAGQHEVEWNAKNYSSGIYFYRIRAGEFVSTKKMLLIK